MRQPQLHLGGQRAASSGSFPFQGIFSARAVAAGPGAAILRGTAVTAQMEAPNTYSAGAPRNQPVSFNAAGDCVILIQKVWPPHLLSRFVGVRGAAQMAKTPCLRKKVVPDHHLKLILFLVDLIKLVQSVWISHLSLPKLSFELN